MSIARVKAVWVTGASGFLGQHAVRCFAAAGWRVLALCRRQPGPSFPVGERVERWIEADWTAAAFRDLASRVGPPDAVFHAVGSGTVGAAERDPATDVVSTIGSLQTLLEA